MRRVAAPLLPRLAPRAGRHQRHQSAPHLPPQRHHRPPPPPLPPLLRACGPNHPLTPLPPLQRPPRLAARRQHPLHLLLPARLHRPPPGAPPALAVVAKRAVRRSRFRLPLHPHLLRRPVRLPPHCVLQTLDSGGWGRGARAPPRHRSRWRAHWTAAIPPPLPLLLPPPLPCLRRTQASHRSRRRQPAARAATLVMVRGRRRRRAAAAVAAVRLFQSLLAAPSRLQVLRQLPAATPARSQRMHLLP